MLIPVLYMDTFISLCPIFRDSILQGAAQSGKETYINPVSFDIHITFRGRCNKLLAEIGVLKIKLKLT